MSEEAAVVEKEFSSFELDNRLIRALCKMGFTKPTLIQEKSLEFALNGKDVVARAITGSGKTLAFCIPILNKILTSKQVDDESKGIRSIIMVPSKELAQQVLDVLEKLMHYCSKTVTAVNLSIDEKMDIGVSYSLPDIIVSTPSRLKSFLLKSPDSISSTTFQSMAIDEADLLLSFGYEDDVMQIISMIPKTFQAFLMSATLTDDVMKLSKLFLRNPVTIKLEEGVDQASQLTEYCIRSKDEDRFLILFFILKLKLVQGKCLIFVEDIQKCYRVKLFLEQFSIKSCVLNSELPYNSRYHIVQEFNRGLYQYLIATDESIGGVNVKKGKKSDEGYGVSRGIDFIGVTAVINFDFPKSVKAYIHRVGRTARGKSTGVAVSFVTEADKRTFNKVEYKRKSADCTINPYEFDAQQLESFRYRCEDALRAVTKAAVNDARLKEIKIEVMNSEKLKTHFAENPNDLQALRHDKSLSKRVQTHLKHLPDYLLPNEMRGPKAKVSQKEITKRKYRKPKTSMKKRKKNVLKSLNV